MGVHRASFHTAKQASRPKSGGKPPHSTRAIHGELRAEVVHCVGARYALGAMNADTGAMALPFDHVEAHAHLARLDAPLAQLIERVGGFRFKLDECDSVYESLLEAIVHQSIAGTGRAGDFLAHWRAWGERRLSYAAGVAARLTQKLRKAGLSHAKIAAVRDLARKTVDGVVPTIEEAGKMSDQELVDRLISVRGIGAWTVEMFLIFRLGRPDVLPIHDYGVQRGGRSPTRRDGFRNRKSC